MKEVFVCLFSLFTLAFIQDGTCITVRVVRSHIDMLYGTNFNFQTLSEGSLKCEDLFPGSFSHSFDGLWLELGLSQGQACIVIVTSEVRVTGQ